MLLSVFFARSLLLLIPFYESALPLAKVQWFLLLPRSVLLSWSRVLIWSLRSLLSIWFGGASVVDRVAMVDSVTAIGIVAMVGSAWLLTVAGLVTAIHTVFIAAMVSIAPMVATVAVVTAANVH